MDKEISILEAVDQLSHMAELDQKPMPALTDVEKSRRAVKETFRTVRNYLKKLHDQEKDSSKDREAGRGIQAMMELAGEAAEKLDKYTALFKGITETGSVRETPEYQDLQHYYLTKVKRRFHDVLEQEQAWEAEWGALEEDVLDLERRGLKDLETVKRDRDYELFYLLRDDGKPFFNRNLMRHIRLVGNVDEIITDASGESPFLRVKQIQEKDLQHTARSILALIAPKLDIFYKEAFRYKNLEWIRDLSKALMALMLAANPRNLMQNTTGKSVADYFKDFHLFLREALMSLQYEKALRGSEGERIHLSLLHLSHTLANLFFMRKPERKEIGEFIDRLIAKGDPHAGSERVSSLFSFWNTLLDQDAQIREALKDYPSGPLLKLFEAFSAGEEKGGFDPLSQGNYPAECFAISCDDLDVSVLHIPTPTEQELIEKPEVVSEFKGFLRELQGQMNHQRHLLVNLQDRTLMQESSRCFLLENLPKEGFSDSLTVVTLPKNTDFYHQTSNYRELNDTASFIAQFKEQMEGGEDFGFYFPDQMAKPLASFIAPCLDMIHQIFFEKRGTLKRDERLDFIEIVDHFLVLKFIELSKPGSMSFTCKDGVDTGAAARTGFFALLKMITEGETWTEKEREFVLWSLYSTALQVRERAIDPQRLHRMASAAILMQTGIHKHHQEFISQFKKLYPHLDLRSLQVII